MSRHRDQEMTTAQMDFMLSEAMVEVRWEPLYGRHDGPLTSRTASGFLNTIPCVRMTVPLPIKHKLTWRDYLRAFCDASVDHLDAYLDRCEPCIDWVVRNLDAIVVCAFLLALAAVVV